MSYSKKVPEDIKIKFKAIALGNNTTDGSIHQICGRTMIRNYYMAEYHFHHMERER